MKIARPIALLSLLATSLPGQAPPQRGLALTQDNLTFLFPLMGNMRWTNSYLAGCDYCADSPTLWTVDREGNRRAVAFHIPGADHTIVYDVAAGPDGSLTAAVYAPSGSIRTGTFIAWFSPNGDTPVVTRVWPYGPNVVAVAPDGTIWAVGALFNDKGYVQYPNVLRHYTASGQLLASTIIQGVRPNSGGSHNVSSASALMASNDRIGWLTFACQYIEFSFEAAQLGSYTARTGIPTMMSAELRSAPRTMCWSAANGSRRLLHWNSIAQPTRGSRRPYTAIPATRTSFWGSTG